jgi:hypothetical protein
MQCVKTKKGVVLFGPPLRSGGEDEDKDDFDIE